MEAYLHVNYFFRLLEDVTTAVNIHQPVRFRTAQEYALQLGLHPNYLNALIKKHTGVSISTHIKNRLLEKSKNLLLQKDWTLQDISYHIGFANQPNFHNFFKKQAGVTPNEFRKYNFH